MRESGQHNMISRRDMEIYISQEGGDNELFSSFQQVISIHIFTRG